MRDGSWLETQTEAWLKGAETLPRSGRHLVGKHSHGAHLRRQFRLLQTINRVYAKYFSTNSPARSFVPVASWPMEFDIQIECVAVA
ncbi:hypothetical protein [Mesorhizobium sp. M0228]|uniref:hypothetical protein n=1 Tax=Mesorhizobium sp. M0228 TaxID=2956923 RepID=UPI003336E1A5